MKTFTKTWDDGQTLTATYNGSGNGTITITSGVNEGLDRSMQLTITTSDGTINKTINITQPGKRELFYTKNGDVFCDKNGNAFLVLK